MTDYIFIDPAIKRVQNIFALIHNLDSSRFRPRLTRKTEIYLCTEIFPYIPMGPLRTNHPPFTSPGVVFAYNVLKVMLWTNRNPKSGCVFVGKNWRRGGSFSVRQCRVEVRLWVNSFPPPVYQSDWTAISTTGQQPPFVQVGECACACV